jgi:putative peptide zinc metalloprotease protein
LLNLNPLIKLDGYLIFCELIHEPDLKEKTTAYLSAVVRKNIFRLPAEVEYVPRRRRPFYIIYAILSGLYGYLLLSFLMVLSFHILQAYSPDWAFVPAIAIGYWVFKSRIKMLVKFIRIVYLDKKERVRAWLTPPRIAVLTGVAVLLLLLPVWPDFVTGRFTLEPVHKAWIHAEVPGRVTRVLAREGQPVTAGEPVVELSNLQLASAAARASADLHVASDQLNLALLRYQDLGPAEYRKQDMMERNRTLLDQVALLRIASPISGVVVTPRLDDLLGSYLDSGAEIAEVADLTTMIAGIYIPEFAMRDVRLGARVRLLAGSGTVPISARLSAVAPASATIEAGLIPKDQLKGITPPRFYVGSALLANAGTLREGMTGTAKIFVTRRSLAGFTWIFVHDLVDRRIW